MTFRSRRRALLAFLLAGCATSQVQTPDLDVDGGGARSDAAGSTDTEPSAGSDAGVGDGKAARLCSDDDFCHSPVASGTDFVDVWGDGTGVLWAVTDEKTVLRWDGASWNVHYQASSPVTRIWGNTPTDIWVTSDDGVLHGTGASSAEVAFAPEGFMPGDAKGRIRAVWGTAPTDVWAVGGIDDASSEMTGRVLRRFDDPDLGLAWQVVPELTSLSVSFRGICGTPETGIWVYGVAQGAGPKIYRQAAGATDWNEVPVPMESVTRITSFWIASDTSVWLVARVQSSPLRTFVYRGVSADGAATYDWTTEEVDLRRPVNAIWGVARDDVWAVGASGLVSHWNGSTWSQAAIRVSDLVVTKPLRAIWGTSNDDFWIVGDQIALHRTHAGEP